MGHNSCPKCGAGISGGGKKCGSCGAVRSTLLFQYPHAIATEADLFVYGADLPAVGTQPANRRGDGGEDVGYAAMTLRTPTTDIHGEFSFARVEGDMGSGKHSLPATWRWCLVVRHLRRPLGSRAKLTEPYRDLKVRIAYCLFEISYL